MCLTRVHAEQDGARAARRSRRDVDGGAGEERRRRRGPARDRRRRRWRLSRRGSGWLCFGDSMPGCRHLALVVRWPWRTRRRWRRRRWWSAGSQHSRWARRRHAGTRRLAAGRADRVDEARGGNRAARVAGEDRVGQAGLARPAGAGGHRGAAHRRAAEALRGRRRALQEHLCRLSSGRRDVARRSSAATWWIPPT